ncbi:helix-turn-helix domain-containing protein [Peribacillus sp. B-H-3]|uniref:helix-turn-helix domain-containing protein n=1 Tax=Peribacillus sp. B-H-3 TaxID=3400420 RepID=UPI003B02C87C
MTTLKSRSKEILLDLLEQSGKITTRDLAARYGLSDRSIRYDLENITQACEPLGIRLVHQRPGVWLEFNEKQKTYLKQQLMRARTNSYESDPNSRMYRLLAVLLTENQPIVVKQIQNLLNASSRTIYGDMDRAEAWLTEIGLQLIRKPHYGAKVEGQELFLRYACYNLSIETCKRFGEISLLDGIEEISLMLREQTDPCVLWSLVTQDDLDSLVGILQITATEYPRTLTFKFRFFILSSDYVEKNSIRQDDFIYKKES